MKNILVFLCIGSMLLVCPLAEAITVSVSDVLAYPGEQGITVSISVADRSAEEIYGIDLQLLYDAALIQATEVATGTLISGWSFISNIASAGQVNIALYSTVPLSDGEGSIAEIRFDVKEGVVPGTASQLRLSKAEFAERPAEAINSGSFTITAVSEELAGQEEFEEIAFETEEQETEEEEAEEEPEELFEEEEAEYEALSPAPRIIVYKEAEEEALESVIVEEFPEPEEKLEDFVEVVAPQTPAIQEQLREEYLPKGKKPKLIVRKKEEKFEKKEEIEIPEPPEPKVSVSVKELKRILFWRVYKLQLEDKNIRPFFWQLKRKQKLPFWMRLNKRKGTIYGIAWGRKTVELNLLIITQDRDRIEASCILEIK